MTETRAAAAAALGLTVKQLERWSSQYDQLVRGMHEAFNEGFDISAAEARRRISTMKLEVRIFEGAAQLVAELPEGISLSDLASDLSKSGEEP